MHMHMCICICACMEGLVVLCTSLHWFILFLKSDTTHSADPHSINKKLPPTTSPEPATSFGPACILVALPRIVREVDPRAKASTAAGGEITSRDSLKDSEKAGGNGLRTSKIRETKGGGWLAI